MSRLAAPFPGDQAARVGRCQQDMRSGIFVRHHGPTPELHGGLALAVVVIALSRCSKVSLFGSMAGASVTSRRSASCYSRSDHGRNEVFVTPLVTRKRN